MRILKTGVAAMKDAQPTTYGFTPPALNVQKYWGAVIAVAGAYTDGVTPPVGEATQIDQLTTDPAGVGSRIASCRSSLGRRIADTYEERKLADSELFDSILEA